MREKLNQLKKWCVKNLKPTLHEVKIFSKILFASLLIMIPYGLYAGWVLPIFPSLELIPWMIISIFTMLGFYSLIIIFIISLLLSPFSPRVRKILEKNQSCCMDVERERLTLCQALSEMVNEKYKPRKRQ